MPWLYSTRRILPTNTLTARSYQLAEQMANLLLHRIHERKPAPGRKHFRMVTTSNTNIVFFFYLSCDGQYSRSKYLSYFVFWIKSSHVPLLMLLALSSTLLTYRWPCRRPVIRYEKLISFHLSVKLTCRISHATMLSIKSWINERTTHVAASSITLYTSQVWLPAGNMSNFLP